ncbi:MAG: EamA family transporter [Thermodesulfovibrionales bacterium]
MPQERDNRQNPSAGYVYAIAAAGFWAVSGTLSKSLFIAGTTPFELVQLRTTIASGVLFVWLVIRSPSVLRIGRSDLLYFLLLGITLAVSQVTYLYAISRIQVAAAILLQYQAPVFIALYAVLFSHKRLSVPVVVAIMAAVAGCFLVSGVYGHHITGFDRAGLFAGLGSAVTFAVYSVKSEYGMRRYQPLSVVFYALFFAAVFWNSVQLPFSAFMQGHGTTGWLKIGFIGVFGTILPFVFYITGINRIGAIRAGTASTMEPVFAGVIAWSFLGEVLDPLQMVGAVLVIAAVILLQLAKPAADPS